MVCCCCCCCLKSNQIPEHLQEMLKRQQQQKVTSGTIVPATVAIQHIKVTKPSVLIYQFTIYVLMLFFRQSYCQLVLYINVSLALTAYVM